MPICEPSFGCIPTLDGSFAPSDGDGELERNSVEEFGSVVGLFVPHGEVITKARELILRTTNLAREDG
jgi:hypothetical protein